MFVKLIKKESMPYVEYVTAPNMINVLDLNRARVECNASECDK